jgi:hypothetical protein
VHSSDDYVLEPSVVRGYVASDEAKPGSIQVRSTYATRTVFPEAAEHPQIFAYQTDPVGDWEISFFRALNEVDGVVLAGGGRSTFIAGMLAISLRLPILALAGLGGAAATVCVTLRPDRDLPTDDEIRRMAEPLWSSEAMAARVQDLKHQFSRRASDSPAVDLGTGEERLHLAYLAVIAKPERYTLLEHLDPPQLRNALAETGVSVTPGANATQLLAQMTQLVPSAVPNPLWLSWMTVVHEAAVNREEVPGNTAPPNKSNLA